MNGWSSKSKAKKAYLRRHNMRTHIVESPNHQDSPPCSPPPTYSARTAAAPAQDGIRLGGGLASISEQLFSRVTSYHAQIGSSISPSALHTLEAKLLNEAEATAAAGEWEEALNVFTHALAVSEKVRTLADSALQASTQAAVVAHIGTCLHHLGELEAAKAYYEEAITSLRKLRPPTYERWFVSALGRVSGVMPPDVNHERFLFLKGRLHDIELGRAPEAEYRGECGDSRWTGIARRMPPRAAHHVPDVIGGNDGDEAYYDGGGAGRHHPYADDDDGAPMEDEDEDEDHYRHGHRDDGRASSSGHEHARGDFGHGDDGSVTHSITGGSAGEPHGAAWQGAHAALSPSPPRSVAVPAPPASRRTAALLAATKAGNADAAIAVVTADEPTEDEYDEAVEPADAHVGALPEPEPEWLREAADALADEPPLDDKASRQPPEPLIDLSDAPK